MSNYADGKYIHFDQDGNIPKGIMVKLYVGDKLEDKDLVNVYYYNNDKSLDLIKKCLKVDQGYIEFDIDHCSEYFVTMFTIATSSGVNPFVFISLFELILLIAIIILDYLKINPLSKLNKKSNT